MDAMTLASHPPVPGEAAGRPARARRQPGLVAYAGWREVRETLLLLLLAGPARIALLGAHGAGKTWMLTEVARLLAEAGRPVQWRLPAGHADRAAITLIDNADTLDAPALEALFANPGATVLAGPPGLAQRLHPHVTATVRLMPLTATEIDQFVATRLTALGRSASLLTASATTALATASGGNPQRLQTLLTSALFLASTDSATQVDADYIGRAVGLENDLAPEFLPPTPAPTPGPMRWLPRTRALPSSTPRRAQYRAPATAVAIAVLIAGGGALSLREPPPAAAPMPESTPSQPDQQATPVIVRSAPEPAPAAPPPQIVAATPGPAPPTPPVPSIAAPALPFVVVTYPRASDAAKLHAAELADRLRHSGIDAELVAVPHPIGASAIGYFFAEDRASAALVANRLDPQFGEGHLLAASPHDPYRRPGTIEIDVP